MALYPCGEPGCTECLRQFGAAQTQAIERKRAVQAFYAMQRQPTETINRSVENV